MRWQGLVRIVVLGCALFIEPVYASAYSEFNAGVALHARNNALSIQHLSAALADPALSPSLRSVALLDRADAYLGQGDVQSALSDLSTSIALRPSYDALLKRAALLGALGRTDAALGDLAKANDVRPDLVTARIARASIFLDHDRLDDAINEETSLIAAAPRDPTLFSLRSAIYRRQGRMTLALADADYAIEVAPDIPNGYYARVLVLETSGRLDEALTAVELELKQFPGRLTATLKRGVILWELNRFADAERAFADAAILAPSNGYVALWRAIVKLSEGGDIEPAIFEKTDAGLWPGPIVDFFRGTRGADAVLRDTGTDVLKRRAQLCEAAFYMAQWHLLHGEPVKAKPLLKRAVQDCPYDFNERAVLVRQAGG